MGYLIGLATEKDMEGVLKLIKELACFEKEPNAIDLTVSDLINDGFGSEPKFICFIAKSESSNRILGIALTYTRYSTWKGEVLHLEDLIVSESMRGHGLGTALLDEVVKYGHDLNVKRISWEVLDWNKNAINFYKNKGANVMRDWNVVQLDNEGIENYLKHIKKL